MFIREQMAQWRELRQAYCEGEFLDYYVWSPVSCRHSCWTMQPNRYGKLLWI